MPRSRRRWLLAPAAAAAITLGAAGSVLAAPDATVAVFNEDGTPAGATVCAFYFEFEALEGGETGSWELWDSSNALAAEGTYEVAAGDGDRHPASGTFSLANGTYLLIWDDESPIDRSRGEVEIVVECAAATEAPGPTATPFQSVGAETEAPTSDVGGETPLPTLPPTTTDAGPDAAGWSGVMAVLMLLLGLVALTTPRRQRSER